MLKKVLFLFLLAVCVAFTGCNNDNTSNPVTPNQAPTITGINPNTFARGEQNVDLTITGTNLSGASLVGLGDGTTVHSAKVTSSTSITVNFSVQRLAVPGSRPVTVSTPNGTVVAQGALTIHGDAPVAEFTITPQTIYDNAEAAFDASGSSDADGTIKSYDWDFGDGKKTSGVKVTHKFVKGSYDVTLLVTDNQNNVGRRIKSVDVQQFTEVKCTQPARNNGLFYGTVIGVEPGNNAIVLLDKTNTTCANAFYYCGDMRDGAVDLDFYGIIHEMGYRGNHTFRVKNDCPFKWPPKIGARVFLFWKSCDKNFCP